MSVTENSVLTFGIHKDKKIKDVPPAWLIEWSQKDSSRGPVKKYIEENINSIKAKLDHGK